MKSAKPWPDVIDIVATVVDDEEGSSAPKLTAEEFGPKVGSPLTERDLETLAARWIDPELARSARIERVDHEQGRALVGGGNQGAYEGLAIPYFYPGESNVREWRLRRDRPDYEFKDGQRKAVRKYLSPPGRRSMLYLPPGVRPELLKLVSLPLIIVEGEFKTLALSRLAIWGATEPRFVAIGLPGVWNWRGTIGKTTGPDGARCDEKGTIPDLDWFSWEGRKVIIAFDADSKTNENVGHARDQLTRELQARGAEVRYLEWDIKHGKGIDDVLAKVGPEEVLKWLEAVDSSQPAEDETISVQAIADSVTARRNFAKDKGGRLYIYEGGTYLPDGAGFVRREVKRLLRRKHSSKWTSHKGEEVVRYIGVDAPVLWDRPTADIVNVLNGLLDVRTRTLTEHSPEFLSPIQIPVRYDAEASCPKWERFVSGVFPEDCAALAWEIPAWLMTPDTSIQKAVLLIGDGANGKSTYLRGIQQFIGDQNVAAVSLHGLENNRFSLARLVGKLANICPDLPTEGLSNTSVFKALTGGDTLAAERKFEQQFEFVPYARQVFSANHPPGSKDASGAFFRRWHIVPFERTFDANAPETIPRHVLDASLAEPCELSGVLNKALDALVEVRRRGLTESDSTRRAFEDFQQTTDPFAAWLDQSTHREPEALIPADSLWSRYNEDCKAVGRPTASKTAIGRAIHRLRPDVLKRQRIVEGRLVWCYVGLGWVRPSDSQTSRGSRS